MDYCGKLPVIKIRVRPHPQVLLQGVRQWSRSTSPSEKKYFLHVFISLLEAYLFD